MKGKLTDFLPDAAGIQDPVRLQCTNGIEAFFDESVHDVAACIPAVAKEIGDHWRYGQLTGDLLHDFHL